MQQRNFYAMAIERISIGRLVIEKQIPDEPEAQEPVKVKAVSGDKAKEAVDLPRGTSQRLAKAPTSLQR
jgi:hypothetical protein